MAAPSIDYGYHMLAGCYDVFFQQHRPLYKEAREALLEKILSGSKSACDLACGTGATAIELAERGLRVFAVDVAAEMCRQAEINSRGKNAVIHIQCADMRNFSLPEKVDVILCEYVSINYVPQKSDLGLVARASSQALTPGGYFYFDVNHRPVFQQLYPHTTFSEESDTVLVLRGGYDAARDKGWMSADFLKRDGECWRRLSERFEQVCWSTAEIRKTLREAGFTRIRAIDASKVPFKSKTSLPPGMITFFVAQKDK